MASEYPSEESGEVPVRTNYPQGALGTAEVMGIPETSNLAGYVLILTTSGGSGRRREGPN
jgi:hypothetical protein